MPTAPLDHLGNRRLGDVEEPGQVHRGDRDILLERVIREWLAEVAAGILIRVSIRPNRSSASSTARRAVSRSSVALEGTTLLMI
jgi:hypothetical protein